jgi:hypothetical protein
MNAYWCCQDVNRRVNGIVVDRNKKPAFICYLTSVVFFYVSVTPINFCMLYMMKWKKKECVQDHSVVIYEHWHVSDQIFFCRLFAHMYTMIPFIFYIIAANFSSMLFVVCKLFYEHNVLPVWIHFILVKKTILIRNQAKWQALVNAAMNLLIS